MKLRRIVSCMMALLLVCSLPLAAFAEEYDLAQGSVTVNASESGQTVTHGTNDAVPDSAPVITQSNSSTPTSNTITITATGNATANVTIQGVNIDTSKSSGAAIQTAGAGDVTIELNGSNTVQSSSGNAGVQKTNSGNLTITDENGTAGSLKATGGVVGAGIGGGPASGVAGNNITIAGGTIEAIGGSDGAGIGGGGGQSGTEITISGGKVTAIGDGYAAGIGGGAGGSGSDITITGGEVKANGGYMGAGIGGGGGQEGKSITISGGTVEAQGGYSGAGIGGGSGGSGSGITITGSAEVTAQGGASGSGIGGGAGGSGTQIVISGGEVDAKGGLSGAGIGGGEKGTGSDITISGDARVNAQGGKDRVVPGPFIALGSGAAIGNGGIESQDGAEVTPNTDELTPNGKIEYYAPDANMETGVPIKAVTGTYVPPQPENPVQPAQPEEETPQPAQPLYRVVGQDGKALACKKQQKDGVLTITVDADFATLTGSLGGMKTLKAQGVDTIVFVTNGATSTFAISDLLAQGNSTDTYALTHVGSTVTLTLGNGIDISSILK